MFRAFQKSSAIDVVQVYGRNKTALIPFKKQTDVTQDVDMLKNADVYIIAITDDHITSFSEKLPLESKLVVHTSGATAMNNLADKHRRGVFYPLQTFSKDKDVDFTKVPLCLEAAHDEDMVLLTALAKAITD